MHVTERLPKETAREYALRVLKENIISLELAPGSMVSENELSSELGLSRTPVREALIDLSKTQIVDVLPQRGSRISLIDYNYVEESRFLRSVLESAVVELICESEIPMDLTNLEHNLKLQQFYLENEGLDKLLQLDNEFHREMFRLANKMQTYHLMDSMTAHFDRVRTMSLSAIKDIKIVGDHAALLQALRDRSAADAKVVIAKHLSRYKIDEQAIR
ncbi:MAG: GntR family transcriptional regulator, partial [Oscillospiraceae bacterium]|nr:GntR family transcriptional regulator [Oscillospiraceae bacterium]